MTAVPGQDWSLLATLVVPAGCALVTAVARRASRRALLGVGVAGSALTLLLALVLLRAVTLPDDPNGAGAVYRPSAALDLPWLPALGARLHLAVDGVNAPLVALTALLTLLAVGHLATPPGPEEDGSRPGLRGQLACLLAVEAGAIGTFLAADLLVFFVAFETVLVPMWLVIARWGDDRDAGARRDAATRFVLFTVTGSALMLLGLLLVALRAGTTDLVLLAQRAGDGLSTRDQVVAAGLLTLGLAVKAPMFPLHTWLPPAHTIAPTAGSVLLAGVLLKMGTYGLVRVVVPVVPDGMRQVAPLLGAFAVAGIVWASLACFAETDLKRLIAFSSVAHMGFVLLGIATMTPVGLQGALYANIAHGLITALLFLLAGSLKDRYHSTAMAAIGAGLRDRTPRLGWLLALAALAGLGLPGLAGFWGEILAVAGAWRADSAIGALTRPLAVLAALGSVAAAVYLLRVLRELWHGPLPVHGPTPDDPGDPDLSEGESAVLAPLAVLVVVLGLVPALLLSLTGPVVRALLGVG